MTAMEILKPYETTTGKLVNTKPLINAVLEYITRNSIGDELAYEFYQGDVEVYIITGKNEEEKLIPVFEQPLYFKNIRNKPSVAIDLRPYINHSLIKQDFTNLRDVVRDKHSANFLILSALLSLKLEVNNSELRPILVNVISALTSIVAAAVSKISVISLPDKVNIEIATAIYAYTLFYPGNNVSDDAERIANALTKVKFSFPIDKKSLIEKVKQVEEGDFSNQYGLTLLENLIKFYTPEDINNIITINSIFSILDNGWYGPGGARTVFIAFECLPVLVSLLYAVGASTMFKSSKIATVIEVNRRKINLDEIVNYLNNVVIKKEFGRLL